MAHGVTVSEVPTGARPAKRSTAGLPVYIGTAPIGGGDESFVNKPGIFYSLAEFVAKCGELVPSSKWSDWTLHEAASAHFSIYEVAPFVAINVADPDNADHVSSVANATHLVDPTNGKVILQSYGAPDEAVYGILESSIVVKKASVTKVKGTDYTITFVAGACVLERIEGGSINLSDTLTISFDYLDPSGIIADDIIGGYSAGAYTGIEVVEQVFPQLRLVPGFVLAPKWSQDPTVAAALEAKRTVNGAFKCMPLTDLSTDTGDIASYANAAAWKTSNGYDQGAACWPKLKHGTAIYHASTVLACVANVVDAAHDGIPYASPSNKAVTGSAAVNDDGDEIFLLRSQANSLNDQGIVTFLNGINGWRLWGNRTAAYPGTTDVKDSMIPVRRMFDWITNTIILTSDQYIDEPGNRRLINSVLGTIGSFLNSLVGQGALVAGSIEFREDENNATDLSDGKINWHVTLTPPSPAEELGFIVEYDPSALAALFEE